MTSNIVMTSNDRSSTGSLQATPFITRPQQRLAVAPHLHIREVKPLGIFQHAALTAADIEQTADGQVEQQLVGHVPPSCAHSIQRELVSWVLLVDLSLLPGGHKCLCDHFR